MSYKDYLMMIQEQISNNNKTYGEQWARTGKNKTLKVINWERCINMQVSNLINCFDWRHSAHNYFSMPDSICKNLLLTIFDSLLSVIIASGISRDEIVQLLESNYKYASLNTKEIKNNSLTEEDQEQIICLCEDIQKSIYNKIETLYVLRIFFQICVLSNFSINNFQKK